MEDSPVANDCRARANNWADQAPTEQGGVIRLRPADIPAPDTTAYANKFDFNSARIGDPIDRHLRIVDGADADAQIRVALAIPTLKKLTVFFENTNPTNVELFGTASPNSIETVPDPIRISGESESNPITVIFVDKTQNTTITSAKTPSRTMSRDTLIVANDANIVFAGFNFSTIVKKPRTTIDRKRNDEVNFPNDQTPVHVTTSDPPHGALLSSNGNGSVTFVGSEFTNIVVERAGVDSNGLRRLSGAIDSGVMYLNQASLFIYDSKFSGNMGFSGTDVSVKGGSRMFLVNTTFDDATAQQAWDVSLLNKGGLDTPWTWTQINDRVANFIANGFSGVWAPEINSVQVSNGGAVRGDGIGQALVCNVTFTQNRTSDAQRSNGSAIELFAHDPAPNLPDRHPNSHQAGPIEILNSKFIRNNFQNGMAVAASTKNIVEIDTFRELKVLDNLFESNAIGATAGAHILDIVGDVSGDPSSFPAGVSPTYNLEVRRNTFINNKLTGMACSSDELGKDRLVMDVRIETKGSRASALLNGNPYDGNANTIDSSNTGLNACSL